MKTERIDWYKIDRACRKQEKKNLREKQKSLSSVSMLNHLSEYTIEVRDGFSIMKKGWREYIKTL